MRGLSHFSPSPPPPPLFAPTTMVYADLHYYPPLSLSLSPTSSLFFVLTFLFTEEFNTIFTFWSLLLETFRFEDDNDNENEISLEVFFAHS